jgi:putative FmdB family regulatory protein
MPLYDFECVYCATVCEVRCVILDRELTRGCPVCGKEGLRQAILTAPMVKIPGSMTHDGITKIVGTPNGSTHTPIIPIQCKEELPDGRTKITTIGDK